MKERPTFLLRKAVPALTGLALATALIIAAVSMNDTSGDTPFPSKQEVFDAEAAWREAALASTPRYTPPAGPTHFFGTPKPTRDLPEAPGITAGAGKILDRFGLTPYRSYNPVNVWRGTVGDRIVVLMAGSLRSDSERGVLVISVFDESGGRPVSDVRASVRYVDQATGALKITGGDKFLIELEDESGGTFVFDVETGRFISPFLEPLPTPQQTKTPWPVVPPLESVQLASLDASVSDRSPSDSTLLRSVESCRSASVGDVFDMDLVIDGLPAVDDQKIGIIGFQFTLVFDPAIVKVTDKNLSMLLADGKDSNVYDASPVQTDAEFGRFTVAALDASPDVTGSAERVEGALARVSLELLATGVSEVTISDGAVIDTQNRASRLDNVAAATIVVGSDCG